MSQNPSARSLAIIGAGPVGLEAAAAALDRGFDVHVFERGEVADHVRAWGHLTMFTPWARNLGPASRARLEAAGWSAPDPDTRPTGREFVERALAPLAALPELRERVHTHSDVIHLSRRGAGRGELAGDPARARHPFRLLVRDAGGRENLLHAFAVLDASGTFSQPNWAGDGGIPARGEAYLWPQIAHHPPDVPGLERGRHAGQHTLVIGHGASAAETVRALAALAREAANTRVTWVTRRADARLAGSTAHDPLPARATLAAEAAAWMTGADPAVRWIGGVRLAGIEYNSATHRFRAQLDGDGQTRLEECERLVCLTGYGREPAFHSELHVARDPRTLAVAETTPAASGGDHEPGFSVVGAAAMGRSSGFLLEHGFAAVERALDRILVTA